MVTEEKEGTCFIRGAIFEAQIKGTKDQLLTTPMATYKQKQVDFDWDIIAVTADNVEHAEVFAKAVELRREVFPDRKPTWVIPVSNPSGQKLGSGGATLHALVQVTERLSAFAKDSYINSQRLKNKSVLIIHAAGHSATWMPMLMLNEKDGHPVANIDLVLDALDRAASARQAARKDGGVWVFNASMLMAEDVVTGIESLDWTLDGMTVMSALCSLETASRNGAYRVVGSIEGSTARRIDNLCFAGSLADLRSGGYVLPGDNGKEEVAMVCGLVLMDLTAASALLDLQNVAIFSSCTTYGVDDGLTSFSFSLFLDVVAAVLGVAPDSEIGRILNQHLNGCFPLQTVVSPTDSSTTDVAYLRLPKNLLPFINRGMSKNEGRGACINSIFVGSGKLGTRSVVMNSLLEGSWQIGDNSIMCGVRAADLQASDLLLPPHLVLQELRLLDNRNIVLLHGTHDLLDEPYQSPKATIMGVPWSSFFQRTGLTAQDMWPEESKVTVFTLSNARLFVPICDDKENHSLWYLSDDSDVLRAGLRWWYKQPEHISLQQSEMLVDVQRELKWIEDLAHRMDIAKCRAVLLQGVNVCLRDIYARYVERGLDVLLAVLDDIAANSSSDIAARALAHIADALAAMAKDCGGLRSGPARNVKWVGLLDMLQDDNKKPGAVRRLSQLRKAWMTDPDTLIRAARHYEGGTQRLIAKAVSQSQQFVTKCKATAPALGDWVITSAPLRIDLAGGWTDTPPIAFEHGGAVANLAIIIDGKRPIGARARRIAEPKVVFVVGEQVVECYEMADLMDYGTPNAPAALLKCCILCLDILKIDSQLSLVEQLQQQNEGYGIELRSFSNVPTGSGLGTSSILAGCLLAAVSAVAGLKLSRNSMVHAVLHAEQMLTTGGGWQDQVGGIFGGAKIARSPATLPMKVETEIIELPQGFREKLSSHLILIYTGRARLARNLLQNVLRRWYARLPDIVNTTDGLTSNAELIAAALKRGDLATTGSCLTTYWNQKKHMADGCEPEFVTEIFEALDDLLLGHSLAGAGGGGFMALITREPDCMASIKARLEERGINTGPLSFHAATVDMDGLTVKIRSVGAS